MNRAPLNADNYDDHSEALVEKQASYDTLRI